MKVIDWISRFDRASWRTRVAAMSTLAATCIFSPICWALPNSYNLATVGTATATGADFGSSISDGIDGNRNGDFGAGSVFYANAIPASPPLFYQVDLGGSAYIDRVQMFRRSDADQDVFGNMRLTIYQDDGAGSPGAIAFTDDYVTTSFAKGTWGTTNPGAAAPGGVLGRFVRLERIDNNYWLTFAEIEVIGSTSPLNFTEADNLAVGKPVTTSSAPGFGALASSANDGDIDGDFNRSTRPVYHSSNFGVGEFWQVDLGKTTALDTLELFARSDGVTTSQYKVSVLDENLTPVGSAVVDNAPFNAANPGYDHTIDVAGMTGRYVRVETTGAEYLAFSELRVFAVPEPGVAVLSLVAMIALASRGRSR